MRTKTNFERYLAIFAVGVVVGVAIFEFYYVSLRPLQANEAQVLTDRDYFPVAVRELQSAKGSIHMTMFSANYYTGKGYRDSSVNQLLYALANAKARNIEVRVILDDWPEGNPSAKKFLENNNVEVKVANDEEATTHAKLIIIDGRVVIVGSTNWSYYSVDKNHEANVIINDESVAKQFETYFDYLWKLF